MCGNMFQNVMKSQQPIISKEHIVRTAKLYSHIGKHRQGGLSRGREANSLRLVESVVKIWKIAEVMMLVMVLVEVSILVMWGYQSRAKV